MVLAGWLCSEGVMFPVRYELRFYIPEDGDHQGVGFVLWSEFCGGYPDILMLISVNISAELGYVGHVLGSP
jgi:hypothetical protein